MTALVLLAVGVLVGFAARPWLSSRDAQPWEFYGKNDETGIEAKRRAWGRK